MTRLEFFLFFLYELKQFCVLLNIEFDEYALVNIVTASAAFFSYCCISSRL